MAEGVVQSAKMIVGDVDYLDYVNAYVDEDIDVDRQIKRYLAENAGQTIIVCTDIFGGSVNNNWLRYMQQEKNIYLIAGLSLPLLIELVLGLDKQSNENINTIIERATENAKNSVKFCNEIDFEVAKDDF
ncbi:PTS mannose transporter subunit IIA [Ligilactobacillus pobuzihii]|nr:PTS mannose transporter subunit IIA [Ligilactobacillus pobuzihii]